MRPRLGGLLYALLSLCACRRADEARCALNEARLVARIPGSNFDAIALSARGARALALWSDARGAWLKPVTGGGAPQAIGSRCAGGLQSVWLDDGLWLSCLAPATGASSGTLTLRQLDPAALQPRRELTVADAGREARGVALAASPERLFVAWNDGEVGAPKLMLREIVRTAPDQSPAARVLSEARNNPREPALLFYRGELWATWAESDLTPGKERHRLMLQRGVRSPRQLGEVIGASPTPSLAADEQGLLIAFRAARKPGARPELMLARLDGERGFLAPPHSIGRANGAAGPSLALCKRTRAVTVPIDHAGELYVAFHPLSSALRTTEENHQYYESAREFVDSAAVCVGDHPLALMAEQTAPAEPRARLLVTAFRCAR